LLNFATSKSITELRFRCTQSLASNILFEKIIAACPYLKSLIVPEISENMLEFASGQLPHLNYLYGFTLKAERLPNVTFPQLKIINFRECLIGNLPQLQEMSLLEQKKFVLKKLRPNKT